MTDWLARSLPLQVGPVAHGGHCVARFEGRVVFVRHALPGEVVRAVVTEDGGGSYCRADAVEVLTASPDRVEAPCRHAGPGRCGGCDWQHAGPTAQRALKAAVVAEQLHRLAGLDCEVTVEELPGGSLGWRTRVQYAVGADGGVGLHRHRSKEIEPIGHCPIGAPGVGDAPELGRPWPGVAELLIALGDGGERTVSTRARPRGRTGKAARAQRRSGPRRLIHAVHGMVHRVDADGFWQVHPAMAGWLVEAVLGQLAPRPGDRALDLYAGAGLFSAAVAVRVGETGAVLGVESAPEAVADAVRTLAALPSATVRCARVDAAAVGEAGKRDLIVLDPPRAGAGADVMRAVLATGARAVSYVACDPAALARDVRTALETGWRLAELRAVDAFPMTHHVECVAQLLPAT